MSTIVRKRAASARVRRTLSDNGIDLAEWRSRHGLTMTDVARQLRLANGLPISNWEQGKSHPRAETLIRLRQLMDKYDSGKGGTTGSSETRIMVISSIRIEGDGLVTMIDDEQKFSIRVDASPRMRHQLAAVLSTN